MAHNRTGVLAGLGTTGVHLETAVCHYWATLWCQCHFPSDVSRACTDNTLFPHCWVVLWNLPLSSLTVAVQVQCWWWNTVAVAEEVRVTSICELSTVTFGNNGQTPLHGLNLSDTKVCSQLLLTMTWENKEKFQTWRVPKWKPPQNEDSFEVVPVVVITGRFHYMAY